MQLELPFLRLSPPEQHRAVPPDGGRYAVIFARVRGARRYIIRVRPDGTVRVTLPRWGSKREAQAFVEQERRWIERERARVIAEHAPHEWEHGSTILLRGDAVRLALETADGCRTATYGDRRVAVQDGMSVRAAIERDLRALAREELVPRLHELAAEHGVPVSRVMIRNQRSRWGSCSRAGVIALNFRLVQMPPDVCDYVLVHELMHVAEQNHSRRFWRLVERACPSFRDAERWLKIQGKALF